MTIRESEQTLRRCLDRLRALEPIREVAVQPERGELVLQTPLGNARFHYRVKRGLSATQVDHFLLDRAGSPHKARVLILTDHLSPSLAARLAEENVDSVDEAGNILLRAPGKLYVRIQGMKPDRPAGARSGGVLSVAGLRLAFVLLADKAAESLTYRALADAADLSLASIARSMAALQRRGFVESRGRRHRAIHRKQELLGLWVAGYVERLRPRLIIGRYRAHEREPLMIARGFAAVAKAHRLHWALTGGLAADLLTGYYQASDLALYVDGWPSEVASAMRWMPSAEGPITALHSLSRRAVLHAHIHRELPVADPLLVYAELLGHGGDRERDAARLIRDGYLRHLEDGPAT